MCDNYAITGEDGQRYITWSAGCWNDLAAYEEVAIGNTIIAQSNANALRKTEMANENLIGAGEMQQQLAEFYDDLLKEERKLHFFDSLIYKTIIGLGLLGATL